MVSTEFTNRLYLGRNPLRRNGPAVQGNIVILFEERFYRIANYDRLRPFFISVVSNADHWLFVSSTGGLTAGRQNPDNALFPYYTDDKVRDGAEFTGSKTILKLKRRGRTYLWEPFSSRSAGVYQLSRNLYKNFRGTKLIFEETNHDLEATFRYGWFTSERFGFVRPSWLSNAGVGRVEVELLDGIQNLMPAGSDSRFQLDKSTLLDAYKKNELIPATGLALFRLSSVPVDRPEPAEALRTTTAWCPDLPRASRLISSVQLDRFRQGGSLRRESEVRAERGAYFVHARFALGASRTRAWHIVSEVNQGASQVAGLEHLLRRELVRKSSPRRLLVRVLEDVRHGTEELVRLVAGADGQQTTNSPIQDARHFNNVLCNIMRGGVFAQGYQVDSAALEAFVKRANRPLARRRARFFKQLERHQTAKGPGGLGQRLPHAKVVELAMKIGDPDLERLCREYLPLTFSRRHGDPSRPWNRFHIAAKNRDGSRAIHYEGNWRDIFQNWEALAVSFPGYLPGMVCRFVNASTADGYNPYRISSEGIDWEIPDPADPWSHIGYWGDHQVVYLSKLLELLARHEPLTLRAFLSREIFSYANVPYRLRPYSRLVENPKETVDFDWKAQEVIRRREKQVGGDAKQLWVRNGKVWLVNLAEKLLVSLLARLSHFIPGAGIWMNTQRPEWNDANNALVGNGASVVTLCYLRRQLAFCMELFRDSGASSFLVSAEVVKWFSAIDRILQKHRAVAAEPGMDSPGEQPAILRRRLTDELGQAASRIRAKLYRDGFSGVKQRLALTAILRFGECALAYVDGSIRENRRPDGLFHAYNLVGFEDKRRISLRRLYVMLEGQVAALSSGSLPPVEALRTLQMLKRSDLFRPERNSYLLYPDRSLPAFIERNNVPQRTVTRSRLLQRLLKDGDESLVERDVNGRCHFNGDLRNSGELQARLNRLAAGGYARLVDRERKWILNLYEELFDHQSFTGRSGTFFGYEGLGCIYWHMVSKLLLAAQEVFLRASDSGAAPEVLKGLARAYHDIRSGIGDRQSAADYGAFPMDPYSHTPGGGGARQPGLTGQVKEDILCRLGELGVSVDRGRVRFRPLLLRQSEFLERPSDFAYYGLDGAEHRLRLPTRSMGFTYCQVPVVYELAHEDSIAVHSNRGVWRQPGESLDPETSRSLFERTGKIGRLVVRLSARKLS